MAERIQLKEPGSELVMAVSKVTAEQVENIEYYCFANGLTELLVPKSSVLSQLERLNVAVPLDIVGKTVKFSRSTKLSKYGKAFWNLDLASGAEPISGGEGKAGNSASTPLAEPVEKPKMREAYKALTEWVLAEIAPLYIKAGIGMSPESAAACTATLFIQASQRGKIE